MSRCMDRAGCVLPATMHCSARWLVLPGVEDDGYPAEPGPSGALHLRLHAQQDGGVLQATARLVEYLPGGFGRTAALLHLKENTEEEMRGHGDPCGR